MEDILISIVIPIYNVEKYLRQCIDSIVTCSNKSWEVLLVDDGSTDKSPEICDEYGKRYDEIKVIHKKNEGVSSARNIGIQHAKGKYITFIDGDDFVKDDYFDNLYKAISKRTDICLFNYTRWIDEKTHASGKQISEEGVYNDLKVIYMQVAELEISVMSVWCQVYRLDIIKNNKIYFDENMKTCEDFYFFLSYLEYVETAYVSQGTSYCYRLNLDSVTSKRRLSHIDDYEVLYKKLSSLLISKNLYQEVRRSFQRKWIRWMIDIIYNLYSQGEEKDIIKNKVINTQIYKDIISMKYNRIQEKVECYMLKKCLCFPIFIYLKCLNFIKIKTRRIRL